MDNEYQAIQGVEVNLDDISVDRVKSIVLAMENHPYIKLHQVIKTADDSEIILASFDIQIPQNPVHDIKETEVVAIICDRENLSFPLVLALRNGFPQGLPHTFAQPLGYPASLCISELTYKEVKHLFNPFWFLERIREWFRLTARGMLHGEDQPLEALYYPDGHIIIPEIGIIKSAKYLFIRQISSKPKLFKLETSSKLSPNSLLCFVIPIDIQVPGFIKKTPTKISDIKDLLTFSGQSFLLSLIETLKVIKKDIQSFNEQLNKSIGILCIVPLKRHSSDNGIEDIRFLFIGLDATLRKVGELLGLWEEQEKVLCPLLSEPKSIEVLDEISISLHSTMDDFSPNAASFHNGERIVNRSFTIIGAGALGSALLGNLSRMGFGHWTIIDNDILFPHNLARHLLGRNEIGMNKATALSGSINQLLNDETTSSLEVDFLDDSSRDIILNSLKSSEVIIDTSTSIAVAKRLALDFTDVVSSRRISMFLSPSGKDFVVLAEDTDRNHRLDLLEMQYYRFIYNEPSLHNHLQKNESNRIRYASNSCRDITQRISQDNVVLFASIASKVLKKNLSNNESQIGIWRISDDLFDVKTYNFSPSPWVHLHQEHWEIYIDSWLINKMVDHRQSILPNETGGILIGSIDTQRKIIYLLDSILAPMDSIQKPTGFIRGKEDLASTFQEYLTITDDQVMYLGEWHSHPDDCSTNPSRADKLLFSYLSEKLTQEGYPTLMLIVGDTSMSLTIELI